MSSWRRTASEEAQQDLDSLVGLALETGEVNLEETGELRPFFIGIRTSGEKTLGTIGDESDAADLVERLVELIRKNRGDYRAVAVVKDVKLRDQDSDAIWVDLCHSEGPSMTCYLPYRLKDEKVVAGEMGAQEQPNLIW